MSNHYLGARFSVYQLVNCVSCLSLQQQQQQQQQGQRQPQMIITHGQGGQVLHQGQQQVMRGGPVLQGNMPPQMAPQGPSSAPQGGNMFDELNMDFLWTIFFFTIFKINFIRTGLSETSWVRKINWMDIESSWSLVSYKENDSGQLHCIVYLYLINMYFDRFWYEIWCRKKNCLILNEVLSFKKRSASLEIFWSFIGIYYVHLNLYIELSILHGFESSFRLRFVSLSTWFLQLYFCSIRNEITRLYMYIHITGSAGYVVILQFSPILLAAFEVNLISLLLNKMWWNMENKVQYL